MNIGIAGIFSYRPHVTNLAFLAHILKERGHNVHYLVCDGILNSCYTLELKKKNKHLTCAGCVLGNLRTTKSFDSISSVSTKLTNYNNYKEFAFKLALSSSCTINRTESKSDTKAADVCAVQEKLSESILAVMGSTRAWIKKQKIDGLIFFNGRMDLTRGILEVCEELNIPYITEERPQYGHGIQLIPNGNCLSLNSVVKINSKYKTIPLTQKQALIAAGLGAQRVFQKNHLEWRLYNKESQKITDWPTRVSRHEKKILILPSSSNEFTGHPDYETVWGHFTTALESFFKNTGITSSSAVVRCHPNWREKIGKQDGLKSHKYYSNWCDEQQIKMLSCYDKANTYDLIRNSDLVIVSGSSAGVEAAYLGKPVILLGAAAYTGSGVALEINKDSDFTSVHDYLLTDPKKIVQFALRQIYVRAKRIPQYEDYVRAKSNTDYQYFEGANADALEYMFSTGEIRPNDSTVSETEEYENYYINKILSNDGHNLLSQYEDMVDKECVNIKKPLKIRKAAFGWIEKLRSLFPRGDV